jgi:hypothetical protein
LGLIFFPHPSHDTTADSGSSCTACVHAEVIILLGIDQEEKKIINGVAWHCASFSLVEDQSAPPYEKSAF